MRRFGITSRRQSANDIIAIRLSMQDLTHEIVKRERDGDDQSITDELKQRRDKLAAAVETLKAVDSVFRVFEKSRQS